MNPFDDRAAAAIVTSPPHISGGLETLRIEAGGTIAEIAALGAELRRWCVGEREILWDGDPTFWARVSPVLFPIVGHVRGGAIVVDGSAYPMSVHGFAAAQNFTIEEVRRDRLRLSLASNSETLAAYPFAFKLGVEYQVAPGKLMASFEVHNPGPHVLPYALGLHPAFRWPIVPGDQSEGHAIVFEREERSTVPMITPGGLIGDTVRTVQFDGRRLPLDDAGLGKEALCFLNARSRSVRFESGPGQNVVVAVDGFPHFALWSRGAAPFLSIEAWTGHSDPENFAGELANKPSMRMLATGEVGQHRVSFSFDDANI